MAMDPTGCEMDVEPETKTLYSEEVKGRLINVFQEMTDKISPENFNEIFKKCEESDIVVKNVDQIVETFKTNLYKNIHENFEDMWHMQDVDFQLNSLDFCKEKCENNSTSWRPTGKTVDDQLKCLRIHFLKKKIAFIQKAMDNQIEAYQSMYQELEVKRGMIEDMNVRRDAVSNQMDIRMAQIKDVGVSSQIIQSDLDN